MTKHKTEYYKISAVKYYLNNDKGDGYKKPVKFLIIKNLLMRLNYTFLHFKRRFCLKCKL